MPALILGSLIALVHAAPVACRGRALVRPRIARRTWDNFCVALAPSALAIEHDIDEACREHPLLKLPYTDALMHLFTVVDLQGAAESSRLNVQQRSIRLTQTISALKYAVRWVAIYATPVDRPASRFAAEAFAHASDFLLKAESYLMIEAAYSWAHREVVDLKHEGGRLTMSFTSPNDNRYEAYDMLIKPTVSRRRKPHRPTSTTRCCRPLVTALIGTS